MIDCIKDIPHFVTGSTRFGTATSKSDIDICIVVDQRQIVYDRVIKQNGMNGLLNDGIKESDYNNGFKFTEEGKEYNIIPLHPRDYVSWYWAAKLMEVLPSKNHRSRPELHGIHETFIGFIKMYFANEFISYDNYITYCEGFVNFNQPRINDDDWDLLGDLPY